MIDYVAFLQAIGKPVSYYPALAKVFGVEGSVFLCHLMYLSEGMKDPKEFLKISQKDLYEETGMSPRTQRKVRKTLVDLEVLEERLDNKHQNRFYRVDRQVLNSIWEGVAKKACDDASHACMTSSDSEAKHEHVTMRNTPCDDASHAQIGTEAALYIDDSNYKNYKRLKNYKKNYDYDYKERIKNKKKLPESPPKELKISSKTKEGFEGDLRFLITTIRDRILGSYHECSAHTMTSKQIEQGIEMALKLLRLDSINKYGFNNRDMYAILEKFLINRYFPSADSSIPFGMIFSDYTLSFFIHKLDIEPTYRPPKDWALLQSSLSEITAILAKEGLNPNLYCSWYTKSFIPYLYGRDMDVKQGLANIASPEVLRKFLQTYGRGT